MGYSEEICRLILGKTYLDSLNFGNWTVFFIDTVKFLVSCRSGTPSLLKKNLNYNLKPSLTPLTPLILPDISTQSSLQID